MKIPVAWLKEYVQFDLTPEQVATKLTMGGLEVEGIEESALGPVLDVYVTPNRGDCLSVFGVARELSALLSSPLNAPPGVDGIEPGTAGVSVTIEDPALCPRYAARIMDGVKVGPSPAWLRQKLEAAGQRAVNNIVDVTNYVMLELGQPMHAFDLERLAEGRIVVRKARAGERIVTLDGEERELQPAMLVIADASVPVAVAGIMGGSETEVTAGTKRILLESAHFEPLSVRRTSRGLGLKSEASYRFERVVDPEGVARALQRCCYLLQKLGLPAPSHAICDVYPSPMERKRITLRVDRAAERLGMELDAEICSQSLISLGFGVSPASAGAVAVEVPSFRADVCIEEDLIEEVGRVCGYENIPETLPKGETTRGGDSDLGRFTSRLRSLFESYGLQEVVTHSLTGPSQLESQADIRTKVVVRNALSANIGGLRQSLLPTLVDVAQHNAARGRHRLSLFEIGRVWSNEPSGETVTAAESICVAGLMTGPAVEGGWTNGGKSAPADFYQLKGVLDRLFCDLGIGRVAFVPPANDAASRECLHPGRCAVIGLPGANGFAGELHPAIAAQLDVRHRIYLFELSLHSLQEAAALATGSFVPIPRQQALYRDLAPRVPESTAYAEVEAAIRSADAEILSNLRLTDIFRGAPLPDGVKSLTLSLTFAHKPVAGSEDRAVTEEEVNKALERMRHELEARCGAVFPG